MNNFKLKKDYSSIITFTLEEIDIILRSKFKTQTSNINILWIIKNYRRSILSY